MNLRFLLLMIYEICIFGQFIYADTCTWNNCPKWNHSLINVHFISHTHDDLGYRKTVDQYYTGANAQLYNAGVQYIFNTLLDEIPKNADRKFSYCETGYVKRWLDDHSDKEKQALIKLVQTGQLELVGGGWVSPDEADSYYIDLIDQYSLGLEILKDTFGECGIPKANWQLDPFGHSREHANLIKLMGYESLFFARLHYLEYLVRTQNKTLDLNWHVSEENGNTLVTHVLYDGYLSPAGFCWDSICYRNGREPIVDNPEFLDYNVDERLNEFMTYLNSRLYAQPHNHFLVSMGQDFNYQDSNPWFTNIDKLIKNLNQRYSNVTAFYSTPTCYDQALRELNMTWSDKYTDFFPLSSDETSYWTGYFTTKPSLKGLIRRSSSLLQLTRQLNSLALMSWSEQINSQIDKLERAMSLTQHHDAVTGTAAEFVTQDYIYRLTKGWNSAEQVINSAMNAISQKSNTAKLPVQIICRNINESECLITKNSSHFVVSIHNSHSHALSGLVKMPLYQNVNNISLLDSEGSTVNYQIVPVFINPNQLNNSNMANNEINFMAEIEPLGFRSYFISIPTQFQDIALNIINFEDPATPKLISNGLIQLDFDDQGYLLTFRDLTTGKNYSLKQEFRYYHAELSQNYHFCPDGNISYGFNGSIVLDIVQGPLVNEARQIISPWISQIIRLIPNKTYVEFEWTIGPIPKTDNISKEVFTRYTVTGLNSNGVFWTDSNGRQLMKRIRNYAESYTYNNTEPIAANYYPITSVVKIFDDTTSLAILTDRTHGGSSLVDGQVELMVQRCLLHRESGWKTGPNEPDSMCEPGPDGRGIVFSGLQQSLPSNINLMTLKQLDSNNFLLRLEHIFQKDEDPTLSQSVSLDLSKLFTAYNITQVQELGLAANKILSTLSKSYEDCKFSENLANLTITLSPMDIKTYQLTISTQNNILSSTSKTNILPSSTSKTPDNKGNGILENHSPNRSLIAFILLLLLFIGFY